MATTTPSINVLDANSTGIVITLTGGSTSWVNGVTTFSLAGGTGASITAQSVTNTTTASITVSAGSAIGALTISNSTDASTARLTVVNWQLLFDDNFTRANTAVGAANNITSVGNNWADVSGSHYSINSNTLQMTATMNDFLNQIIRPSVENITDVRYVVDLASLPASSAGAFFQGVHLRRVDGANSYLVVVTNFYYGSTTAALAIYKWVGSVQTNLAGVALSSPVSGHSYEIDVKCFNSGTNLTSFSAKVVDTTTSTVAASNTLMNDATSNLQGSGGHGLGATWTSGSAGYVNRVRAYYNNNAGMVPSTEYLAASSTPSIVFTGTGTAWTGATTLTNTNAGASNSITSQSNVNSTTQNVTFSAGSVLASSLVTESVSGAMAVMFTGPLTVSASPPTVNTGVTNQSLALSGTGTKWTTQNPTFALTGAQGASGFSVVSQTINSDTSATLVVNTGTTGGQLIITDPVNAISTTLIDLYAVPITDTNLYFSPYNWVSDGSGTLQSNNILGASTKAQTICPGAYIALNWTGSTLILSMDTSSGSGGYGSFYYSIDNGQSVAVVLSAATSYTLATGLAYGSHTLKIYWYLESTGEGWTTQVMAFKYTGIKMDGASAAPTLKSKLAIFYGDSYTEGTGTSAGPADNGTGHDAIRTIAWGMAGALQCEYGIVGAAADGYSKAGLNGTPPGMTVGNDAQTSWNKNIAGVYRTYTAGVPALGGILLPAPDYIVSLWGTNDVLATQAQIQAWINAVRAAAGTATIIMVIPPNQTATSQITGAFNAYQAATPDTKCFLLTIPLTPGITGVGTFTTFQAIDNLHPRGFIITQIAAQYMLNYGMQLGAQSGGASSGYHGRYWYI